MALRTFEDSRGKAWRVWDVVPQFGWSREEPARAPGPEDGWLCFESGAEKRRLAPIPAGWAEADSGGLEELLRDAAPVARRLKV